MQEASPLGEEADKPRVGPRVRAASAERRLRRRVQRAMSRLDEKLLRFKSLGREMRMQLLLGYAKKFPELPEELRAARDEGLGRVDECQTPLFLWVSVSDDGKVAIHADAPREAPTVRGFVGFLMDVLNGESASEVAALPDDLMERMGLDEILGVMRTRGLGAVLHRVKRDVARAA